MSESTNQILQQSISRASVYRLLARLWICELDAALLDALAEPEIRSILDGFQPSLEIPELKDLEDLQVEYCRLFVGPTDHLPPLQSVWQEAQLHGEAVVSFRNYCELVGYQGNQHHPHSLDDHFGLQLDLMAKLLDASPATPQEAAECIQSYFVSHLDWSQVFLEEVQKRTSAPFYRSLSQLTQTFLRLERQSVAQ